MDRRNEILATLMNSFRELDQKKDGTIEHYELRTLLQSLDGSWTVEQLDQLFEYADAIDESHIQYEALLRWCFDEHGNCGYTANESPINIEMGCYILTRGHYRKVTEAVPEGNDHKPNYGIAQGICSDGNQGCFAIRNDAGLYQISKDFAMERFISGGWESVSGMCSDGGNGCFIISKGSRLWHVTQEFPEGAYWSSGWRCKDVDHRMCPGPSGCFILNSGSGKLWLASKENKEGKVWSDGWTSGLAKLFAGKVDLCEDGNGGCFVMSGAGTLFHVTAANPNGEKWSDSWAGYFSTLGGLCWDGNDGCFVVTGAGKLWHATPSAQDGKYWSSNWYPEGCMASLHQSSSNLQLGYGHFEIVNTTTESWLCKLNATDEEKYADPPMKECLVSADEKGKLYLLGGMPDTAWLRLCDLKGNVLQRSYVASGHRINITDSSSERFHTREGLEISPYTGYVIEISNQALHDRVIANSMGLVNEAAILEAEGPDDYRQIWLGCELIGPVPYDFEGAFHWGVVIGDPETSHAWEVTAEGALASPMCVVGPNGIVAHSPLLQGKEYENSDRKGRTLSQYGPGPRQRGRNRGGYILLPHKTNKTDADIEAWIKIWVKENPTYGIVQCQTFCKAIYTFLVGHEFPYYDGKVKLETFFTSPTKLPHYQTTFQWTCRSKSKE